MSRVSALAVTRMTGVKGSAVSPLSCLRTEMPSSFGIMMSSRTRSGSSSRARRSASSPSTAVTTSYPCALSRTRSTSKFVGLSSATSIRGGVRKRRLPSASPQEFAHFGENDARAERFGEIAVASRFQRLRIVAGQGIGRDGDDRDVPQFRICFDSTGRLIAVDDRQLNIHENEVRPDLGCHCNSLFPIDSLQYLETGIGEQIVENTSIVLGILDDEYALAHAACLRSSARIGKKMVKVEPVPGVERRSMRPPCAVSRRRAIESPSPVPPFCRVMLLSIC